MYSRAILTPDLGKQLRVGTISLLVIRDQGCGGATRRKEVFCKLIHVRKAEKPPLFRFQAGAQNGDKRSPVEQNYNRSLLPCELTISTPLRSKGGAFSALSAHRLALYARCVAETHDVVTDLLDVLRASHRSFHYSNREKAVLAEVFVETGKVFR